jgi:hypothetical protein
MDGFLLSVDAPLSLRRERLEREDSETEVPDPDAGRLLELEEGAGSASGAASVELDRDATWVESTTTTPDGGEDPTTKDAAVRSLNTKVSHIMHTFWGLRLPCQGIACFASLTHFLQQLSPQLRQ